MILHKKNTMDSDYTLRNIAVKQAIKLLAKVARKRFYLPINYCSLHYFQSKVMRKFLRNPLLYNQELSL